jgi:hypothetical protein
LGIWYNIIMTKKISQKQEEFPQDDLGNFFKELNRGSRIFFRGPSPEQKDLMADWVTTSGSSKESNKLIEVSAWQTGQVS